MTDIVERLLAHAEDAYSPDEDGALCFEAAAEIERLRSTEVTPAMLAAALAVEPLTYAAQGPDGRALTAELRAENMRRVLTAALAARRTA